MTILKITVEDEHADLLRKLLQEISFVKSIDDEHQANIINTESTVYKITKIMDEAKGKDLFKNIEDPSAWQRELRKEWDRDLSDIN